MICMIVGCGSGLLMAGGGGGGGGGGRELMVVRVVAIVDAVSI
jgi:hypothetical protein